MTAPYSYTITPGAALQAYQTAGTIQNVGHDNGQDNDIDGFGAALSRAVDGAIATGHDADAKSIAAIEGHGSITDVVTAVSKAEIALQTTSTIRDRMVQAYQDIMRMPI